MEQASSVKYPDESYEKPTKSKRTGEYLESRRTDELIVGLCGPIGSGVSTVGAVIKKIFISCGYDVDVVKISELIDKHTKGKPVTTGAGAKYSYLQLAGNKLRKDHGVDILSQLAIKEISTTRHIEDGDGVDEKVGESEDEVSLKNEPRRHVTILDSLKNPGEVDLLQNIYRDMFYLFGVLCTDKHRKDRLRRKSISEDEVVKIMEFDKSDSNDHGQQLLKTLKHADFFVRNNKHNINSIEEPVDRFIGLILGKNDITPTFDEFGMYIAESAAKMSGCMSRQVGAALLTEEGDIVATGRNDVPRGGGGLYNEIHGDNDNRCFNLFGKSCSSNKYKQVMLDEIKGVVKESLEKEDSKKTISNDEYNKKVADQIIKALEKDSKVKNLLEYSRAVHAEMDAITSAARQGSISLRGTTLYSTTFPCHHCARHIVAAGVKKVYYIEPYEKSLALELHYDSIMLESECEESNGGSDSKVVFLHFEGVAPKKYLNIFAREGRKDHEHGRLIEPDLKKSNPVAASLLDNHIKYESKVVQYIESLRL